MRPGFVHNVLAHPLLVLCPPLGEWLHKRSEPEVPTRLERRTQVAAIEVGLDRARCLYHPERIAEVRLRGEVDLCGRCATNPEVIRIEMADNPQDNP